jgi:hypothetical protein
MSIKIKPIPFPTLLELNVGLLLRVEPKTEKSFHLFEEGSIVLVTGFDGTDSSFECVLVSKDSDGDTGYMQWGVRPEELRSIEWVKDEE